ncbi:hypothetical protein [Confluentibacter flavum]|uniref:Uncharacterized protein n=1 Tax=Confluentibacter flavum TaxID=1909700 RepID=A0A2N3HIT3_9FLAO|nr:hypothetical protein [Confluentibacter flavum]PKQ44813.1 hypothetical protein CSW08_11420 [Confluentibacter flavum]
MSKELDDLLIELENEDSKLIEMGKNLIEINGMTEFTFFCHSILNRTINLNRGYITLINDNNYIAAAPLVRLNLDSLLRLFASTQSEFDVETFAKKVRKGEIIRKMKYFKNHKERLTDSKLVELIKEIKGFKWTEQIYDAGSGYIHLSNQHFYSSVKIVGPDTIESGIRKTDEYVPEKEKIAGTYYMQQASKGIRIFIGDWIEERKKHFPNNG